MSYSFWIKRFFAVLIGVFVVVAVAQYLKNDDVAYALTQGAIWAPITAIIFTASRFFQARRGQHCALCKDTPEMRDESKP
ncbi:hypothetical protein [Kangiella koreensis]|uniref:Uncharacterized protein n=1 Tax=Kangiella koreensis (strain DSM 16069 / JCM 12317 / KCTC 12182 / SW-125) TaxID=523791 RepID=C7R9R8_KANKD|nr:hypothetical protein [Kangiella koreensis]ACV27937.1 hypothetical protein Kkor_2529 [Kangiella koreensis DSM 16069]